MSMHHGITRYAVISAKATGTSTSTLWNDALPRMCAEEQRIALKQSRSRYSWRVNRTACFSFTGPVQPSSKSFSLRPSNTCNTNYFLTGVFPTGWRPNWKWIFRARSGTLTIMSAMQLVYCDTCTITKMQLCVWSECYF